MKLPDFKKISKREKMALMIGGAAVFLLAGYYLAFAPWLDYRAKLKKQIRGLERAAQSGNSILSRETDILRDRAVYERFVHLGGSSDNEIAAFLKEIETIASQTQVSLQEIRPLSTESGDWHQEYGLEVRFVGSLPDWIRFVYALESAETLFTISKVQMEKEAEDPKTLKGAMQIKKLVVVNEPVVAAEE